MALDRRSALKLAGAATLGSVLGAPFVRPARAAVWAELDPNVWGSRYVPKKILEIHCVGGVSPWETFWVHEDRAGAPDFLQFTAALNGMTWHCPGSDSPATAGETRAFGQDAANRPVRWGPATKPLWRQDILSRTRLVALAHKLQPHEAAAPLAITGNLIGRARLAGSGAAIQHRAVSIAIEQTGAAPLVPSSFVLAPHNLGPDDYQPGFAAANGQHPGFAQPIVIRVGTGSFEKLLRRDDMSRETDQLASVYAGQFRDKLRFAGEVMRSAGFQSYETALKFLLNAPHLANLLGGDVLTVSSGRFCATVAADQPPENDNVTRAQLRTAAALLANGVRHVAVFDGGVDSTRNYDTHDGGSHLDLTSSGVFRLCTELAAVIGPGAGQVDLNETMIVINSEFGRTVGLDPNGGRNHWPRGYAATLIGGPVASTGVAGALAPNGMPPTVSGRSAAFSPTDLRGAILLAAGIDPFASENFAVQEFSGAVNNGDEGGTRTNLRRRLLGA